MRVALILCAVIFYGAVCWTVVKFCAFNQLDDDECEQTNPPAPVSGEQPPAVSTLSKSASLASAE